MSFRDLFRVKPLDKLVADTQDPDKQLKRALGPVQLTFLGIGAIVGAGIFSLVGTAAAGGAGHTGAGPALVLSFVLVAIACSLLSCELFVTTPVRLESPPPPGSFVASANRNRRVPPAGPRRAVAPRRAVRGVWCSQ